MVIIKSPEEIVKMRASARLTARIINQVAQMIEPGVTTLALDEAAEAACRSEGAEPAFLGYAGYPKSLCVAVNEEVVHGIPSGRRRLKRGDIASLDFGVLLDGFYGDAALTVPVDEVSEEALRLMRVTRACLEAAIEQVRPGRHVGDISHAVQTLAESEGFAVVRQFVGHGIGRSMHEAPQVPNFGQPGEGVLLRPGMVLAIEPMVNAGTHRVRVLKDGWTAVTEDGRISAHFEHTVAVTENGPEVLTRLKEPGAEGWRI